MKMEAHDTLDEPVTAGQVKKFLSHVPDGAELTFISLDSDSTQVSARWDPEEQPAGLAGPHHKKPGGGVCRCFNPELHIVERQGRNIRGPEDHA